MLSTTGSSKSKASSKKILYERSKQPQEKYGASPALLNPQSVPNLKNYFGYALIFSKAVLTQDHYSYFYYCAEFKLGDSASQTQQQEVRNEAELLGRYPDILYSSSYDGEIVIEWNAPKAQLELLTLIDMTNANLPDPIFMHTLAGQFRNANHPNLLNMISEPVMLNDI